MSTPEKLTRWADQLDSLSAEIRAEISPIPPIPPTPAPVIPWRPMPVIGRGYDSEGYTILPEEHDSLFLYVAKDGSDNNIGTESSPFATIDAAQRMAIGNPAVQGIVLLTADQNPMTSRWVRGSTDPTRPFVVKCHPSISRASMKLNINRDAVQNLALVGLDLDRPAIRAAGRGLLLERCTIEIGEVQTEDKIPEDGIFAYDDVDIRLCDFIGGYNPDNTAQGLFLFGVRNWLIEGCLFLKNGWSGTSRDDQLPPTGAKVRSHAIYAQTPGFPGVVSDCIIIDPASHGLHGRPGVLVIDSVMVGCPIGIQVGYCQDNKAKWGQASGRVTRSLFVNGGVIDSGNPRGWGVFLEHIKDSSVDFNDFVHMQQTFRGMAPIVISRHSESIISTSIIENNRAFGWPGGVSGSTAGLTLVNNQLDHDLQRVDTDGLISDLQTLVWRPNLRYIREQVARMKSRLPERDAIGA